MSQRIGNDKFVVGFDLGRLKLYQFGVFSPLSVSTTGRTPLVYQIDLIESTNLLLVSDNSKNLFKFSLTLNVLNKEQEKITIPIVVFDTEIIQSNS